MNDEPCTREDLEAVVPCWDRYNLDENGYAKELVQSGMSDPFDLEEYVCGRCGEYFTPAKLYDGNAIELAWQRALEHVKVAVSP